MEGCVVTNLKIDSRRNCLTLDPETIRKLQSEIGVSATLEPGTHVIRIESGAFSYGLGSRNTEPYVLLWLYGGKFINKKTNASVEATWSSLNGYDDTLTLEVTETATLCAFFFDSYPDDNSGELTLTIVRIQ
jgi:hypothetical protein